MNGIRAGGMHASLYLLLLYFFFILMTDYMMIFPEIKMLFERLTTTNGDHWIEKSYNFYRGTVVVVIV